MAGSVLLIDDDVDVLRSIGNYFEQLGYEVTRELSGEAGLATFDRLRPEVVILDLLLPGMNGMEVLESLRQRDAAVILLTGRGRRLHRGPRHAAGRRELPHQAGGHGAPGRGDRAGGRQGAAPPDQRGAAGAERAGPWARFAGQLVGHAGLRPPGRAAGPERAHHGAAHRRERHRQGLGGADDPRPEPPRRRRRSSK